MKRIGHTAIALLLVGQVLLARPAMAATPALQVDYAVDGSATGAALVGGALFSLVSVDTDSKWQSELLPFDEGVKQRFSARAASLSDALALATVATPVAAQLSYGFEDATGEKVLLYSESLVANFLLNSAAKNLVQRPRPYVYNEHTAVQQFAERQGRDSRLSFYSGHAAMTFGAAVAGSYLFALSSEDSAARATMWGIELAFASATANLRVRAGRHFYSDILAGALIGSAVGYVVPRVHLGSGAPYAPGTAEWVAIAGGVAAGTVLSEMLPLENDISVPLAAANEPEVQVTIAPLRVEEGAGLMLAGSF